MKKWLKYLLLAFGLILLLIVTGYVWLTRSETGTRWILDFAASAEKPLITFEDINGNINSGIQIGKIRYSDTAADVSISNLNAQIDYHLFPLSVEIKTLDIGKLDILMGESTTEKKTTSDLSLPLKLDLKALNIHRLLYRDADRQILADNTFISLQMAEVLNIRAFKTQLSYLPTNTKPTLADEALAIGAQLELSGQSELKAPWKHQMDLQLIPVIDPANPDPYLQLINGDSLKLISNGNTQYMQLDFSSSGDINLKLGVELRDLYTNLNWQAQLQSEQLMLPLTDNSNIGFQALIINSSGSTSNWQLDGNSHLNFTDRRADSISGQWQLKAIGEPQNIEITRLALSGEIGNFDFHGSINPDDFSVGGELGWKNLSWPPGSTAAKFKSPSGNMVVNGTLNAYQLNGQFTLAGTDIPAGVYQLEGAGSRNGLQLQRLNSRILDGEVNISGDIQWQPNLLANFKVNGKNINPGNHWPSYNGDIGVDMNLQWQAGIESKDEQLNIQLHQLNGLLRDYPLQASGNIQMLGGNHLDIDINASSGDALLELQGKTLLSDPLTGDAKFKVVVPDLAQIIAEASGQINAQGQLQQLPGGQHLLMSLQAANLRSAGSSLDKLALEIDSLIPLNNTQSLQFGAQIDATIINLANLDLPIESLKFTAKKPLTAGQEHILSLNINANKSTFDTRLKTQININQGSFSLAGMLQSMNVFTPVSGKFALQEPARIQYADMQMLLTPTCFRQQPDSLNTEICLEMPSPEGNKQTTRQLKLDNFPLAWITTFLSTDLVVSQSLSGTVTIRGEESLTSVQSAEGSFSINPGIIASADHTAGSLETGQGLLKFKLDPGKQFNGLFDLPFKLGTGLNLEFNIDQTTDLETANITGTLDIILDDLIALKWLVPGLDDFSGTFETHLQAGGKLADPLIEGIIDINNVDLIYTPLGVEISKLNLKGSLASGTQSNLQGHFFAGEGEGHISLGIDNSSAQSRLNFSITGTDLQLLNAPNLKLTASPDLSAIISGNQLTLNGDIGISSALISPPPGMISSTPISDDVVVTGLEVKEAVKEKELPLDINGTVKVTLGDDVRFVMDMVKTRLAGGLDLVFEGNSGTPMASGSIRLVDGFFHQYGQNLEFLDSEIHFDGKEVSNPILNIYAVRRIFADPDVELAGISLTGRPDSMRLQLYTDPETNQESAVAYLATGSNFDHGNGVGALNIGTYIYPKLFISYGIGLFDTGNEVSARYELSGNWAIQGTSAESGSGVDVLYSIDR